MTGLAGRRPGRQGAAGRRLAVAGLLLSVASTGAALALVRPAAAAAAPTPLGRFGLTVAADAITSSGTVDASGGLVLTDSGAATVGGRLDDSPSARTMAVTAEPGTTVRTLSASMGGPAPPGAQAQYPGGPVTSTDDTGTAVAAAQETSGSASATGATPADGSTAASAAEQLVRAPDEATLSGSGTATSGTVTIGPLVLGSVTGSAAVSYDAAGHHATAGVTVSSASVGGQAVSIDAGGVHALGQTPLPSGLLPVAPPPPVEALLAQAGVTVRLLAPVMTTTARGALADSGALVVTELTPDAAAGTGTVSSAQDVTLFLGRATATLSDADRVPAVAPVVVPTKPAATAMAVPSVVATLAASLAAPALAPPRSAVPAVPGHTVTTVIGVAAPAAAPPPPVAAPVVAVAPVTRPALRLLGHELDGPSALAGFAAWELFTLGIATTGALLARRRTEPVEGHLCPCP